MELNYLVYFRTVAQTEHISQAAAQLHITQPALSRAISRVEDAVGAQLFERSPNSIRLSHAGRTFLRRVEEILSIYDDALREASDSASAEAGSVKLLTPTQELVTGFLRQYVPAHPRMQIFHQLADASRMRQSLETHGADFAICPPPENAVHLYWQPLFREQYRLAVSIQHPLAARSQVELAALSRERFVFNHGSSMFADLMKGFCNAAGFEPRLFFMGDETDFALELVAQNLGIMFVPASMTDLRQHRMLRDYRDRLRFLDLSGQDCSRVIGIARLKNGYLSQTALATLQALKDYYLDLGDIHGFTLLSPGQA